jgi:hypothetical protein
LRFCKPSGRYQRLARTGLALAPNRWFLSVSKDAREWRGGYLSSSAILRCFLAFQFRIVAAGGGAPPGTRPRRNVARKSNRGRFATLYDGAIEQKQRRLYPIVELPLGVLGPIGRHKGVLRHRDGVWSSSRSTCRLEFRPIRPGLLSVRVPRVAPPYCQDLGPKQEAPSIYLAWIRSSKGEPR